MALGRNNVMAIGVRSIEIHSKQPQSRTSEMLQLLRLTFSLLPWIPVFLCKVVTEGEFSVLEGESLTIPCHYEPQYTNHVKYWCQGALREFCTSLARTDDPQVINPVEERVSIFDDPAQQVFTVTMNKLKEGDSGWYMCGVEIGGVWKADDTTFTNIKVIHGLKAVNSRVSGVEGSSVTVQCLYSERYRESEKKWCRSGDPRSCLSTGSVGSYENSSMAIRDDRTGAFTVTFKKLHMTDTAWYWCSAGPQMITVRVHVTPRPTTTVPLITARLMTSHSAEHLPPTKAITTESWSSNSLPFIFITPPIIFIT
ncbi:LOW QUALITY PROTEIN: polymeric immunoglobulin receptor [Nematolebias whitei]|uniref:LOW QUALITY PROTEIN: polymeric immunoglobulin receptor n=1 Tax=Nematolebias whitei TaxID=451745 RepID=UPI00189B25F8|nr:LOW QUALITY PROTEIN: polymeric immunoglobulin receptor [Nematolebias whitei]